MPTFKIEYAMDVPAYGETLIHARSLKQAEAEARKLYKEGNLIDSWEPIGEISEDHRVVAISRECGAEWKRVSDGFPLDEVEVKTVEESPGLSIWIAYDPDQGRIVGHSDNAAGAVLLRGRYPYLLMGQVRLPLNTEE
jgi:hypothetical protein